MAVYIESTQTFTDHQRLVVSVGGDFVSVTVTSTPSVAGRWIRSILYNHRYRLCRLVVGLGVQWTPSHFAAATLQLCVGHLCLIFQLHHSPSVPNVLRRFLLNPNHTFVGLWNHSDAMRLECSEHTINMSRYPIDMRHHAVSVIDGRIMYRDPIETIVRECLGMDVEFDEAVSRSDWEIEYLDGMQITQATMDAYCSFKIGIKLNAWQL